MADFQYDVKRTRNADVEKPDWLDGLKGMFSRPTDPKIVKQPTEDAVAETSTELFFGPAMPSTPELFEKFKDKEWVNRFVPEFKKKVLESMLTIALDDLDEQVRTLNSVKKTREEGILAESEWDITDPKTIFPKDHQQQRARIIENGKALLKNKDTDPTALRKLMLTVYTGLGVHPKEIEHISYTLTHKIAQGLFKADEEDLTPIITGVSHQEFLRKEGKLDSWGWRMLGQLTESWEEREQRHKSEGFNIRRHIVPAPIDFGDGISAQEVRSLHRHITNILKDEGIPSELTEQYTAAQDKRFQERVGDLLTSANKVEDDWVISILMDKGIQLWKRYAVPALSDPSPIDVPVIKRLKRAYGDEWLAKFYAYYYTMFKIPLLGVDATWAGILSKSDWAKKLAVKMATEPKFYLKWMQHQAKMMGWMAFAELVQTPLEFFSTKGLTADKLTEKASDFFYASLFMAPITTLSAGTSHLFRGEASKYAKEEVFDLMKKLGDLHLLAPSEFLAVQKQSGSQFLRKLRGTQLGDNLEAKGFNKMKDLDEVTGFDLLFKAFGGTELEEKALTTKLAQDLALAADQPGNYLTFKSSEQHGRIHQNIQQDVVYSNDPGRLINEIDMILENDVYVADLILETSYLGVGGYAIAPSRQSGKVNKILDYIQTPSRRVTDRATHVEKTRYNRIWHGTNNKEGLLHAEGYSDQYGVELSRDRLILEPFKLGEADIQRYYQFRQFYNDKHKRLTEHYVAKLNYQGYKAVLTEDLDGYGQQLIVKKIELPDSIFGPGNFEDKLRVLPKRLQTRIRGALEHGELNTSMFKDVERGSLEFYDVHDVGRDINKGIRWYNPKDIGPITRPVGFNPGFSGGVRYNHSPFSVVAINLKGLQAQKAGKLSKKPPIIHVYVSRHQADARNFMTKSKKAANLEAKGYQLSLITNTGGGKDMYADIPHNLIVQAGHLKQGDAQTLANSLRETMGWSAKEVSNFVLAVARPAMNPFLQQRKGMLLGQNFLGKGRLVYKEDGTPVIKKEYRSIKSPPDAAMDYIQKYTQTLGTGNVRDVITQRIDKFYGKHFVGGNVFGELLPGKLFSLSRNRERAHAKALQQLLFNIYSVPTKSERRAVSTIFTIANPKLVGDIGTRVMDEVGLGTIKLASTLKTIGSAQLFAFSTSALTNQLLPVLDSLHANTKLLWLNRLVVKPLLKSKIAPVRFLGHTVDTVNMNPIEAKTISSDAMKLLWTRMRLLDKDKPDVTKLFKSKRIQAMAVDFDRSFLLGEMRRLHDFATFGGKTIDASFSFLFAGEGMARVFSFAAARRAMELEFNFAKKLLKRGKVMDVSEKEWLTWIDPKLGTMTEKGMRELHKRSTDLAMNMTKEDMPRGSRGFLGVLTQYRANIAAQLAKKYIFGDGFSKGQKVRMALVNGLVFGAGAQPFLDDILAPFIFMWQAAKQDGKQYEEYRQDVRDAIAGTIASAGGMDEEVWKSIIDGGLTGLISKQELGTTAQHNYATRLYASAIITDFLSSNINRFAEIHDKFGMGDVVGGIGATAKLAPSTNVTYKNMFETPKAIWEAVAQMHGHLYPDGNFAEYQAAQRNGTTDKVLARDLDNIKKQTFKNFFGIAHWLSFLDTFGANIVGEEFWQTPNGRKADPRNPYSERWRILSGLGVDYEGAAREMRKWKKDKEKFWFNKGRSISKKMTQGNYEAGQEEINENLKIINESDTPLLMSDFMNGLFFDMVINMTAPQTGYQLDQMKNIGKIKSNALHLDTTNPTDPATENE